MQLRPLALMAAFAAALTAAAPAAYAQAAEQFVPLL
ncbi:MAG: hypothetical protein JWP52_2101, partial [Rhizobacter sp.]|nr:hypothetical protein [Rhizobacter sp.]